MLIIGHRGAPTYEPENTLRSFERAIALGADMLEFDVFALPSGEAMIIHDRKLDRTTNGTGFVLQHSYRELRKLDAGRGEKIPTLNEVLDLIDRRVPVIVELKSSGSAQVVAAIIETYVAEHGWDYDQFLVSSFDHRELYEFKTKHAPHINVGASTSIIPLNGAAFAQELQACAITPDINALDQTFVDDAHRRGLQVYVWTVETYQDTLEAYQLGVDGVFSNAPDVSLSALATASMAVGMRADAA